MGGAVFAAEWSASPSISLRGQYDSNLLVTHRPHEATYGYWISPTTEFSGKTENLDVTSKIAADFVDYYGGAKERYTNIFLPLSIRYRTLDDEWGFTGGFTRDNTLMGEFLTTGVVLRFTQRNLWSASPTWTRKITEKLALRGGVQFSDATYEDGLRLGLVNYRVWGGSAGLLYELTERDSIQFEGIYSNFSTTNGPFSLKTNFPGGLLTVSHTFTETLRATVFGGPRWLSSENEVGGTSLSTHNTVWIYGVNLMKQFEHSSLQVGYSRDIFPSGFGLLAQTDRVSLLATSDVSDVVTVSLSASAYSVTGATSLAGGGTIPQGYLFHATPKLKWNFAEWWSAEFSYTYRWFRLDGLSGTAQSHGVMFMLTHYFPKLSIAY